MRLHTDKVTMTDVFNAARHARVDLVKIDPHGSRSRDHAFEVNLEGESRRRPNGGRSGRDWTTGYAATWDQWGVFLAYLFAIDPRMTCWAYDGVDAFNRHTAGRFAVRALWTNDGEPDGMTHWPEDAHGDHSWKPGALARTNECRKCSAKRVWS